MNAEEKEQYFCSEYLGAPLNNDHIDHMNFRCQKSLATWIRITAATEKRDVAMVIRRLSFIRDPSVYYINDGESRFFKHE